MQIDVITLFPGIFVSPLQESLLKKAQENGLVNITVHNLRDWCKDKHKTADDTPYGGGPGMVMKVEPLFSAIESIKIQRKQPRVILLSPQGQVLTQQIAKRLLQEDELLLICGRYEGIDERVRETIIDEEISIGDYVLNGGELPALVLIEAVTRLIPGVVGDPQSILLDSFYENLLDYPHYTRPAEFRGLKVPEILLTGHHGDIARWRRKAALDRTRKLRPDILGKAELTIEDMEYLKLTTEKEN